MTGYLGKTTNRQRDVVGAQVQEDRAADWGPIPGEIVSYNASKGTATVRPLYTPLHNGEPVAMPDLLEVPVDMPRTGKTAITYGDLNGSRVMLTPTMRSMENYDTDGTGAPSDARMFSLSDMRASVVGGDSLTNPLPNVDPDNLHIRADAEGTKGIKMTPEGAVSIEGKGGNLATLLAEFMRLVATDELLIKYGSSAGTSHQLFNRDRLIEIADIVEGMTF